MGHQCYIQGVACNMQGLHAELHAGLHLQENLHLNSGDKKKKKLKIFKQIEILWAKFRGL